MKESFYVYIKQHCTATGNGFELNIDSSKRILLKSNDAFPDGNSDYDIVDGKRWDKWDELSCPKGHYVFSKRIVYLPVLKINITCKHLSRVVRVF